MKTILLAACTALITVSTAAQSNQSPSVPSATPPELGESMTNPCFDDSPNLVRVTQEDVKGKLVHKVQPAYPEEARQAGIQGTVVMCASIGKDGKIKSLRSVSGPKELVPAAMKAVKKWRYAPFQVNNETVDVETDIRVNFALTR